MKHRQNTFYTFQPPEERWKVEQMADRLGDNFIGSHFEKKWRVEYYFTPNNDAFLEHIAEFDTPVQIREILHDQLEAYKERTPVEPSISILQDPVILVNQWLENTRFICKNAYIKSNNEVYSFAVDWCDWKSNQISSRHGLNLITNTAYSTATNLASTISIESSNAPCEGEKIEKPRSDDTQRKARQAVSLFEYHIEEIIKREWGKHTPLTDKEVVDKAISMYCSQALGRNLGTTEKSLTRYLKDIGKETTAKNYGRQLVGQLRRNK